jgi:uncharacterized protein
MSRSVTMDIPLREPYLHFQYGGAIVAETIRMTGPTRTTLPISAIAAAIDPTLLNLFVLPTEQCNLRCTYCYEKFSSGRMPLAIQDSVVKLVNRRAPDLTRLHVNWFGGEPLLASDIVLGLGQRLWEVGEAYNTLTVTGDVTTNGMFLTGEMAGKLAAIGIRSYQISLDGTAEQHDSTRRHRDGRGSFRQIWANLLEISQSSTDVDICLRVHLHRGNTKDVASLASQLLTTFGDDPRFRVIYRSIENLGMPTAVEVLDDGPPKQDLLKQLSAVSGSMMSPTQDLPGYICYAARPNSLVVRSDGSLGKCTVALQDPRNNVGRISGDGHLVLDNEQLGPWLHGLSTRDAATLECPAIHL